MTIDPTASHSAAPIETRHDPPGHAGKPMRRSLNPDSEAPGIESPASAARDPVNGGSPPPDWNLVHFDVGCARCGEDLRGMTDPKCPACALEFDWADAVPLEELTCLHCAYHLYGLSKTRCPECGETFSWQEVLRAYYVRNRPSFEYQWKKAPFKSSFRAWAYSLRPWRLWNAMSLHDPPQITGLTLLWILSACTLVGLPWVLGTVFRLVNELLLGPQAWAPFFNPGFSAMRPGSALWGVTALITFQGTVLLTLLTMRWSLAKCRVRWPHVLRVVVYVAPALVWVPALMFVAMFFVDLNNYYGWVYDEPLYNLIGWISLSLTGFAFLWTVLSLGFAYRRYIKMRHAWLVGFLASITGALAAMIVGTLHAAFNGL